MFVSYSRTDEQAALKLIELFQEQGFSLWWDGMLEAGTVFTRTTEQALEEASAVVVLWSANSVESNWVRDEAQVGRDKHRLVPVSLDGSQPPLGFRQYQSVDLSEWKGSSDAPEILNIRNSLARLTGEPEESEQTVPSTLYRSAQTGQKVSRVPRWLLAALAAVLVAGAGLWLWPASDPADSANSIAILPFDNLSEDADQDYFATGLSQEMRQVLSQNASLQVVAQTSTEEAATDDATANDIAAALGVTYLLDGSVRRAGDVVRISVQLIDGTTGFDVWSETYERSLDDIFAVQSEVATKIVGALQLQVTEGDGGLGRKGGTDNPAAYDAFLRGQSLYDLALDESTDRAALRQFEIAIEADPDYGAAWAALARAQTTLANSYASDRPLTEAYAEATASASKAVEVAPDLAVSHAALGFVLLNGRLDAAAAEGPYREAYRLGGGDADILQSYATFAARIGDFESSKTAIRRASELDPLSATAKRAAALVYYAAGDYELAEQAAKDSLELSPDMRVANRIIGDIAYVSGDYETALSSYRKEQSNLSRLPALAMTLSKLGKEAEAQAAFAELQAEFGQNGLYQQAQVLAQTGKKDQALDALERAFAANDSGLVLMRNDPMFAPLRAEPRFIALLQRMGFTAPD